VAVAQRRRHGQLRVVAVEVGGLVDAGERLRDVRLRAPDDVAGALGHDGIEVVLAEQVGHHQAIFELFEHLVERDALFFIEAVGHSGLRRKG
jgi:hypothetical protein